MKKGTGADAAAPEVTGFCIPYPGLSGGPAKEGHTKLHFEKDVGRAGARGHPHPLPSPRPVFPNTRHLGSPSFFDPTNGHVTAV